MTFAAPVTCAVLARLDPEGQCHLPVPRQGRLTFPFSPSPKSCDQRPPHLGNDRLKWSLRPWYRRPMMAPFAIPKAEPTGRLDDKMAFEGRCFFSSRPPVPEAPCNAVSVAKKLKNTLRRQPNPTPLNVSDSNRKKVGPHSIDAVRHRAIEIIPRPETQGMLWTKRIDVGSKVIGLPISLLQLTCA